MTQQINLYEERLRPRHEVVTARNVGRVIAGVCLLVIVVAGAAHFDASRKGERARFAQQQLAEAQKGLAALTTKNGDGGVPAALASQLELARAALATRQEIIGAVDSGRLGNHLGFSALLAGFGRQAQGELWITGLAISAGGEEIEIRGRALDAALLPAYVQALGREPVFQGRRFAALELRTLEATETAGGGKASVAAQGGTTAPAVGRVADFVLRSENGGSPSAARGEARR